MSAVDSTTSKEFNGQGDLLKVSPKAEESGGERSRTSSLSSEESTIAKDNDVALSSEVQVKNEVAGSGSKGKSLKERGKIPFSLYITVGCMLLLQFYSDFWTYNTVRSLYASINTAIEGICEFLGYSRDLVQSAANGKEVNWTEYATTALVGLCTFSVLYIFVIAPFRAGLWTGERARKHQFHRYMGLLYLIQYFLAWVEFLTDYESAKDSYLPQTITLNGLLQGISAYVSFKVLPELDDAGYYSDKAVISRNFIHENIYFTLLAFQGAMYYNDASREAMRAKPFGWVFEIVFLLWPYVFIRPFFPTTRFKDAGRTKNGRSEKNVTWYQVATLLVKFFYLWAKYFLGFYLMILIYLDLPTEKDWKFMNGLLLLNVGTVSLAIFLHTLRFKKVLPPKFTFSIYLLQIYATFSAIPFAYDLFAPHPKLIALVSGGLLCNMTRDRRMHALWCLVATILITNKNIEW